MVDTSGSEFFLKQSTVFETYHGRNFFCRNANVSYPFERFGLRNLSQSNIWCQKLKDKGTIMNYFSKNMWVHIKDKLNNAGN